MSNLIAKFKGNKRSAFFLKYFVILAAMIVAGFIITGSALMVFVYNFSKQETLQNLSRNSVNISNIALRRNWIVSGGNPDTKRAAQNVLNDFRVGRLGKLTLDVNE